MRDMQPKRDQSREVREIEGLKVGFFSQILVNCRKRPEVRRD